LIAFTTSAVLYFVLAAIATDTDIDVAGYHYPLFIPTAIRCTRPYFEARFVYYHLILSTA